MIPDYPLFINGQFKDTVDKHNVINPATGEIIAQVSIASDLEVEEALSAARQAFDHGPWPWFSFKERKEYLLAIAQGILDKAGELARLETLNTGKPIKESTFMDIPSAAKTFEHIAYHFEGYLKNDMKQLENVQSFLVREPQGVVVLIVPWNYPLLIACWKLASALAAGNTVILKPASLTPLTALELAKIVKKAGIPPGVVNVLNGSGNTVGQALCADRRVDMISFTGSSEVGKQIIAGSSAHLKKLVMELGGKSAALVLKDADLELAVNGSLCSIFLNQGQMCTAMSRIFIEDDVYDAFMSDFVKKAKSLKLGKGTDFETQMGPLISAEQRTKVVECVAQAKKEGARVVCGGEVPSEPHLQQGFFFPPIILEGVTPEMTIFREEVFGPVVCVHKFSDIDEAVTMANSSDYALACTIWSRDISIAKGIAQQINAGIFWINTYGMFYNALPYGGFKQSGFGKELGEEGFLEYTRLKNLIVDTTEYAKPLVNYWYGF